MAHHLFQDLDIVVAEVAANQIEEGFLFFFLQVFDQQTLMRPRGASGKSVLAPEVEQYHLAAVIADFKWFTVLCPYCRHEAIAYRRPIGEVQTIPPWSSRRPCQLRRILL